MEDPVQATRPSPRPAVGALADIESVFQDNHDRVFRAAYRITGSAEDAEDVLQTVFLRLLRRDGPPVRAEGLAPYLHRAAVNAALDVVRNRKKARTSPLEEVAPMSHPDPGPERHQDGRELAARLRRALAELNPRAAEIFSLRYLEGFGNREIARMLDTSWSTVAVTLHRTRARLRRDLGGMSGGA